MKKQFKDLTKEELKELFEKSNDRAKKKGYDKLSEVRCVRYDSDEELTETEKVARFWANYEPAVDIEYVTAMFKAIKEKNL